MPNQEAKQYIDDVLPAIQHLFDGIEQHLKMDFDPMDCESSEYWAHRHARDELCGSLITVIARFFRILKSKGELSTQERLIQDNVKKNKPCIDPTYCWGREIIGLHIGTILHFARNRAAHYEEGFSSPQTRVGRLVWEHIEKHPTRDFPQVQYIDAIRRSIDDCGWISANILGLIGWTNGLSVNREQFLEDINHVLDTASKKAKEDI